jgi:hypothetical protein
VRIVRERSARCVENAPRHPEVNQENATSLEPNNQILAAAPDFRDALALELGRHLGGLERTHEPRIVDPDAVEAPSDEDGLEPAADGLDLGKLRHGYAGVTIGCPGMPRDGALPPSQALIVAPTSANSPSCSCPDAFRPST